MSKNPELLKGINHRLLNVATHKFLTVDVAAANFKNFLFLAQQFFDSIEDFSLNSIRDEIFPADYAKQLEVLSYIENNLNTKKPIIPESLNPAASDIQSIIALYQNFASGAYNPIGFEFTNPIGLYNACLQYLKIPKEEVKTEKTRVYKLFEKQGDVKEINTLIEGFIEKDKKEKILEITPRITEKYYEDHQIKNYNDAAATSEQKEAYNNREINIANLISTKINPWQTKEREGYKKALALFTIASLSEKLELEIEELNLALKKNDLETIKIRLDRRPELLYTPDSDGKLFFHTAIFQGNDEVVDICLKKLKILDMPSTDPKLLELQKNGREKTIPDTILESPKNTTKIAKQIIDFDSSIIWTQQNVKDGIFPDTTELSTALLHSAIFQGKDEIVDICLKKLNILGMSPIDSELDNILEVGWEVSARKVTPVDMALIENPFNTTKAIEKFINADPTVSVALITTPNAKGDPAIHQGNLKVTTKSRV